MNGGKNLRNIYGINTYDPQRERGQVDCMYVPLPPISPFVLRALSVHRTRPRWLWSLLTLPTIAVVALSAALEAALFLGWCLPHLVLLPPARLSFSVIAYGCT